MKRHTHVATLMLIALAWSGASPAEIYRWTDAQGRVHFTQALEDVPAEHRAEAERRWADSDQRVSITGVPDRSSRAAAPRSPNARPAAPPAEFTEAAPATASRPRGRSRADRLADDLEWPGGKPEAWWRGRYAQLASAVRVAERKIETIEGSSASPGSVDYSRSARYDRKRARWERNKALRDNQRRRARRVGQAEVERAKAEEELAAFREHARRSGVPPGWVRD